MQHMSLLSVDFLLMVVSAVVSIPLYIVTIILILRKKRLDGTFYKIYIAMGIVNIFSYFNKLWLVRLPLFTCSSCLLAEYFSDNATYWWLVPSTFLMWQMMSTQYFLSSLIAIDRFIVIVLGPDFVKYWKKLYIYAILVLCILPIIFTKQVLWSPAWYEYLNTTGNFRYTTLGDLPLLFNSSSAVMMSTCGISLFFNVFVFLQFYSGKMKVPGSQRAIEIKLFINCVVDMLTQMFSSAFVYFQKYMQTEDPDIYNLSRILALSVVDVMILLPPFILLLTCADIREPIFNLFRRSSTITAFDNSKVHVIPH